MKTVPDAALNQHIAILGKTGSGKTYAAKGIVEGLLRQHRQVCVIDPTGAWWGLRLGADGKSAGYDMVLLGGKHADIPLAAKSGPAVARLVTQQGANVVIDTSGFTVGEYTRWFIDFAGTLYTTIKDPFHLVMDEAHYFMPQSATAKDIDTGRMLHAGNRLMSGGRSLGIRGMMITQRPAKLHKDSLTCADTLIAMRVIAPQDRKAIKEWIDGSGDPEQGKKILDSLAQLQKGEGWVWYPEGGYLERVAFPEIKTYDSSATPKHGAAAGPKVREIKLDEVKEALAEAVREAEANDPAKLREKIAELTRTNKAAAPAPDAATRKEIDRLSRELSFARQQNERMGSELSRIANAADGAAKALTLPPAQQTKRFSAPPPAARRQPPADGDTSLKGPEREALAAFAWFSSIGVDAPTKEQVCFKCGWRPTSGHIGNVLGRLRTLGLVDGLSLTDEGKKAAPWPDAPATLSDYHRTLRECLEGPQQQVFDVLLGRDDLDRAGLCEAVGWSASSGHIGNVIGALRTFGVVEKGQWRLSRLVYPEGLA